MTGNIKFLKKFRKTRGGLVSFTGAKGGRITGEGIVTNGRITLHDVNYVEELEHNLLSVSQVCDNNFTMHFTNKDCIILKPGFVIPEDWVVMRAPRLGNTYVMDMS